MTEFGLNVYTSYKTIIPVEHLEKVNDEHKYHIYFIMSCPKIIIDKDSLSSKRDSINVHLKEILNGNENTIKIDSFILHPLLDHRKIQLSTQYPYNILNITINHNEFLEDQFGDNQPISINMAAQAVLNHHKQHLPWEFEVLYIGQSFGKNGERTAQKRLASHSTLQKILTDCHSKYHDKQLYILLLEMTPMLNTSFDGITKKYTATESEEDIHFYGGLINLPEYQQVINITEAALINYFKPFYNTCFVDNFPNSNHKGYQQYFALDYNCLTVELDLEFEYPSPQIHLHSNTNRINSSWDFIEYNLFNDPDRKNMYEIFNNKE